MLLADAVVNWYVHGDALIRLSVAADKNVVPRAAQMMSWQGSNPASRVKYSLWTIAREWSAFSLAVVAVGVALAIVAVRERRVGRDYLLLSVACLSVFLVHAVASISLTSYVGIPIQARYHAPLVSPLALLIALLARDAARKNSTRLAGMISAALISLGLLRDVARTWSTAGDKYSATNYRTTVLLSRQVRGENADTPLMFGPWASERVLGYGDSATLFQGVRRYNSSTADADVVYLFNTASVDDVEAIRQLNARFAPRNVVEWGRVRRFEQPFTIPEFIGARVFGTRARESEARSTIQLMQLVDPGVP